MTVPDPVFELMRYVGSRNAIPPGIAFSAGVVSSLGPCLGIRLAALSGLTSDLERGRRTLVVFSFAAGIVAACLAITCSVALLRRVVAASSVVYVVVAVVFIWYGLRSLILRVPHRHGGEKMPRASVAMPFLHGTGLGLIASPCCTPIIASLAMATALTPEHVGAIGTSIAFSSGHVSPILLLGLARRRLIRLGDGFERAAEIVTGGVLVSLGAYYAFLA